MTLIGGRRVLGRGREVFFVSYPRHRRHRVTGATGVTFASLPPRLQTPRWQSVATAAAAAMAVDAADTVAAVVATAAGPGATTGQEGAKPDGRGGG